ncbi:MAG TPA: hypothetical protein PLR91_11960, partial [Kiritimatiellia bacterium]|nr:hypothetical protein [Kiritimatiellia bacterium]
HHTLLAMTRHAKNVNLQVAERDFKYYIFDWDDNILHMPTRIHLEKRMPDGSWRSHSVSTAAFAVVRNDPETYRPPGGAWANAFVEFQDAAGESESRFLLDTRTSLERVMAGALAPGPSFETLRETLREGRLFAIVTARGHESESLKKAVRLFVDVVLTRAEREEMMANLRGYRACFDGRTSFGTDEEELTYYLDLNRYHAVTNPAFKRWMAESSTGTASSEHAKQFAIRDFVEHVIRILSRAGSESLRRPISVGFSDDDIANVRAVERYIQEELARRFPGIKFCVYDTSDPALPDGRKVTVSGQLDFGF